MKTAKSPADGSAKLHGACGSTVESVTSELLTISETAKLLNIGTRSIWRWSRCGIAPPPVYIGRSVRYRRSEYLNWIAAGCPRIKGGAA